MIFYGMAADKPLNVRTVTDLYNTIMRAVLPEDVLRSYTGYKSEEMTALYDHPALMDQIKKLETAREIVEAVWK